MFTVPVNLTNRLRAPSSSPPMPDVRPPTAPEYFHVLAKSIGPICNLDCEYCFFLSKETLYPGDRFRMAQDLLETYIRQLFEAHASSLEVVVAWQGGEPTVMGVEFFRRAVELTEQVARRGQRMQHTIQTNGTLLTDEWCELLAEIMGRNKFGPQRGPWEDFEWQGWWGDDPPFHTPVFVLTHHVRPSITLGDTTFHFLDASPQDALATAMDEAGDKDVRIGGGVATVSEYLDAGPIDQMHVAVSPIVLGAGERLWERPDDLADRFFVERVPSPSGVTHGFFWRR